MAPVGYAQCKTYQHNMTAGIGAGVDYKESTHLYPPLSVRQGML